MPLLVTSHGTVTPSKVTVQRVVSPRCEGDLALAPARTGLTDDSRHPHALPPSRWSSTCSVGSASGPGDGRAAATSEPAGPGKLWLGLIFTGRIRPSTSDRFGFSSHPLASSAQPPTRDMTAATARIATRFISPFHSAWTGVVPAVGRNCWRALTNRSGRADKSRSHW